jgi:hypothetical protein
VKGTNIESIAETVNTVYRTFRGFRKQALLRSIYQFCSKDIQRVERAGIPLYWPKPLGGVGFEDKDPYAPAIYRKAAAVILSKKDPLILNELTNVSSAWDRAAPSRSGRASLLACKHASDISTTISRAIPPQPDDAHRAQVLNDPATNALIRSQMKTLDFKTSVLEGEKPTLGEKAKWSVVKKEVLEMTLDPAETLNMMGITNDDGLEFEYRQFSYNKDNVPIYVEGIGTEWTEELVGTSRLWTRVDSKVAWKFINDAVPALISRDFTLSRVSKAKELNIRSIAVAIKRRMSELTKRWGSVRPIDEKKAIALLNELETTPVLLKAPLIQYVRRLEKATSPRDRF